MSKNAFTLFMSNVYQHGYDCNISYIKDASRQENLIKIILTHRETGGQHRVNMIEEMFEQPEEFMISQLEILSQACERMKNGTYQKTEEI
jgi:hypothetical protein